MKTIIHLMSGGLDSTVLLYDLVNQGHRVHCALFQYGQKHSQELTFAKGHCRRLAVLFTTLDVPSLRGSQLTDGSGSFVVPNRNAVMLSIAANLAEAARAEAVTYACNRDDQESFPDCRPEFVACMNSALRSGGSTVEICAPYIHQTKREIVTIGRSLQVPIYDTWSCYIGGEKHCGRCPACVKRQEALCL